MVGSGSSSCGSKTMIQRRKAEDKLANYRDTGTVK